MSDEQFIPSRLPSQSVIPRETSFAGYSASASRPALNVPAVAWRHRGIVISFVILAMAIGTVIYVRATRIYSAVSELYIQQPPTALKDEASTVAGTNSTTAYLFTQCSLIQSTAILSGALEVPGVADLKCLQGRENPVGFLKSVVTAQPTKQGDLILVSMESTDPKDASGVVNGVVQAYIDYQSKQHQSTAVEVIKMLQKEADRHEEDFRSDQAKMLAMKKANPELSFQTEKGGVAVTRLSELYTALSQAQFRALDLKTGVIEAEGANGDTLKLRRILDQCQLGTDISPLPDPELVMEYRQQQRLLESYSDTKLGANNPEVMAAKLRLTRVQTELQESSQRAIASCLDLIRQAQASADEHVKQLQDALATERESMVGLNIVQSEYDQLYQDSERTERAMELLDSRIKDINVNEDVGSLTVSVLETAKPDWVPVRPIPSKVFGTAFIAGLMVGLGIAVLRDILDQRLRTLDEISTLLDLPVIGAVPRILRLAAPGDQGREIHLRPRSAVAEAYRTIRTAIYFGMAEDRLAKTILVTSPSPGEGKSTCIANLAIAITQAGRKVLIIDADCRRPSQQKIFKLPDGVGLSTYLIGKCSLDDAIRKTDIPGLDILPCGPLPHNPAELMDSQAMLNLLAETSRRYDQVLVDSPPVLPVTDSRILAASCDASILLLRAKRSTRRSASMAHEALASVGARVLGVVINDVSKSGNGYDYTYYGAGRYGSTSTPKVSINGNGHSHDIAVPEDAIIDR